MKQPQPKRDASSRRRYARTGIEITSIEFAPMSEEERQKAIAALVELFMPLLHGSEEDERAA